MKQKTNAQLDAIVDTVLSYRPKARSKPAVQRKRRRTILEKMTEKRVPIELEFDFTNKMEAFGAALVPEGEGPNKIIVNMAAILWLCAEQPDEDWKTITSETIVHELLHVVQGQLGKLLHEGDIERGIEAARHAGGLDAANAPQTEQQFHPYEEAIQRAEQAEAARAALIPYVQHKRPCLGAYYKQEAIACTCGLAELLAEALPATPAEPEKEWPCTCLPEPFDEPCEGCKKNKAAAKRDD